MSKIKRGGYLFVTWVGDHAPKHVHVYKDKKCVLKFDIENWKVMQEILNRNIFRYLTELKQKGML